MDHYALVLAVLSNVMMCSLEAVHVKLLLDEVALEALAVVLLMLKLFILFRHGGGRDKT